MKKLFQISWKTEKSGTQYPPETLTLVVGSYWIMFLTVFILSPLRLEHVKYVSWWYQKDLIIKTLNYSSISFKLQEINIFRNWKYKYKKFRFLVVSLWIPQMHFIHSRNRLVKSVSGLSDFAHHRGLADKNLRSSASSLLTEWYFTLQNVFFRDSLYDCIPLLYLYIIAMM